ncbi:TAXI family TRAP transporter solute-binding subunit [Chloroflexota bacterium]
MKKKIVWLALSCLITASLLLTSCGPKAEEPKEGMPEVIGISTYAAGSKGIVLHAGMGHAVEKLTGIKVRVVPTGSATSRAMAVISGECLIAANVETGIYEQQGGIWDWGKNGPQKFALAWIGPPASTSLVTRGDSGIKTHEDMKGRKMGYLKEYEPSSFMLHTALLAYGGLTWDDVVKYEGALNPCRDAVKDATSDVCGITPTSSFVYELGASVHGAYVFQFPPNDEAWAKAREFCPFVGPAQFTAGYGASKENSQWWPGYPYPLACRVDADEELIYTVTKAFIEGYDLYKDCHPEVPMWNLDAALNLGMLNGSGLAYHPGAVRAFKEIGKWTERHDKWQQSRLDFAKKVATEYTKTVDEAAAQKIAMGSAKFLELWEPKWAKMRVEVAKTIY